MQQPNEKSLILVPKESLLFGALFLYTAIEHLASRWGISADQCYEELAPSVWEQTKKLSPQGEAEIIEAWTKTIQERNCELN